MDDSNSLSDLVRIKDCLKDLNPPGPDKAKIPGGWKISETGLSMEKHKNDATYWESVAPYPVILKGRLKDLETGHEWLELAYFREGEWRSVIVERETAMHKNKIIELAASGFPVNTTNAKSVVDYLTAYEALNLHLLAPEIVSTHLGWQEGGEMDFSWEKHT